MRIKVKYSSSEGPHQIDITQSDIDEMMRSGNLTVIQNIPGSSETKTISINGTKDELIKMAEALQRYASTLP